MPTVKYKGQSLEVVFEFQYLGVCFNYSNKFNVVQKSLYDKASRAMFGLLKKCRKLMLPLDIQTELFDRLIVPILLYGCEVWCPMMTNLASKLQLCFYKIILKSSKSTPSCMVYGELGQFPLEGQAKCRMLKLWFKLVNINYMFKFSNIMYKFLYELYRERKYQSPFLSALETVLNGTGLSGMWTHQFDLNYSNQWFKSKVTRVLRDQYIQQWSSEIETKEIYYNYRMFENVFAPEDYLQILPLNLAYTFVHFRTLNHRLPIQRGRVMNLPYEYEDRLCTKCSSADIGDEFHYVFSCPFFFFFLLNPEKIIFHHFIVKMQMLIDFSLFCSKKKKKTIISKFSTLFEIYYE